MVTLYDRLIRVAYAHPELQGDLLPVLNRYANSTEPFELSYQNFEHYWNALLADIQKAQDKGFSDYGIATMAIGNWAELIRRRGPLLVKSIIEHKSIPSKYAKAFEMAARIYLQNIRIPKAFLPWMDKNRKHFELLLLSKNWPEKTTSQDIIPLGPFQVNNTVGLSGTDLDKTLANLERATHIIKGSNIPGIHRVLYGTVNITGQLLESKTLAWYYRSDDTLYVRPLLKIGRGETHNLIHELGHRYWFKVVQSGVKSAWAIHHMDLKTKTVDVDMPKVGDPLPVSIKGLKERPIIKKELEHSYVFDILIDGEAKPFVGTVTKMSIYNALAKPKRPLNFPTPYSSKNEEEHFCEALALYLTGSLQPQHEEAFKRIWL